MTPRLVLLPGLDGTGRLFDPFVQALGSACECQVIRYPERADMGIEALTQWTLTQLCPDQTFALLGESFSGPIAIKLAARLPGRVTGLILCCTFASSPNWVLDRLTWALPMVPFDRLPFAVLRPLLIAGASPAVTTRVQEVVQGLPPPLIRARLLEVSRTDVRAELARLQVPVLGLQAKQDRLVPRPASAALRAIAPGADWFELDGPHALLQVNPGPAAATVNRFMAGLPNAIARCAA